MLDTLDAAAVRRWCGGGLESLRAHQHEIDELNVYPVPDGDTGTNLVLTLTSAHEALTAIPEPAADTPLGRAMRRMARGALLGARGNSGVIVSQILRGMADSFAASFAARGRELATALRSASEAAYAAVARPVEGTVLSVVAAAADAAGRLKSDDPVAVAQAAARAAAEALARTPQQLPVLARAGVVDAGGRGLVLLLEALVDALARPESRFSQDKSDISDSGDDEEIAGTGAGAGGGARAAAGAGVGAGAGAVAGAEAEAGAGAVAGAGIGARAGAGAGAGIGPEVRIGAGAGARAATGAGSEATVGAGAETGAGPETGSVAGSTTDSRALQTETYEVQYLLDAPTTDTLKQTLSDLGDSLVIVGTGDDHPTWNVHIHVPAANIGPALEAGVIAGRPHRISVTPLHDHLHHPDPDRRGAVVGAVGYGLAALFEAEGATVVGHNPSTGEMLAAITATNCGSVVLLPNDANTHAVASSAAKEAEAAGVRVSVVPTRSPVQALAALAVRDPQRPFADDVIAMAEAAGACRYGEVCTAQRDSLTVAGQCRAGDLLGLVDGEVHVIGDGLGQVSRQLLDRMLGGGGELVTLVLGADASPGLEEMLRAHLAQAWPFVEVQCYAGGQPRYHLLVGVE